MAQEHVGCSVEQQRHRAVFEAVEAGFLFDRQAGGNAAHVADLEIEQHQSRVEFQDGGEHMASGSDPVDVDVVAGQCCVDFVEDRIGVGRKENSVHIRERSLQIVPRGTWVTCKRYHDFFEPPAFCEGPPVLEIHIEQTDNYTLCRPSGEIDAYTVGSFREALTNLAESERLVIDLSDVPFMDSAGLGALIGGIRKVREAEGAVAVSCDRPTLLRLLHTTGFDRIVPVTESLEDAEEALDDQQNASD